jgi:hypothetical protein
MEENDYTGPDPWEEEYTGLNPWHEAVCLNRGLICIRCNRFYQGEENWRYMFSHDSHRWFVMVAAAARELGWRLLRKKGLFLCPKCVQRRKLAQERKKKDQSE